ncbi:MAG: hypothetical protein RLZZ450_6143 [Pseudomonadota bacterium]|jgi:hypothetical protein
MGWAFDQARGRLRLTYIWALLTIGPCFAAAHARADGAIDAWASWALAPKVWKGQTVLAPEPQPRPNGAFRTLQSLELPVQVHVPVGTADRRALHNLRALERAWTTLHAWNWPLPNLDGGYGGRSTLDLYAVPRTLCAAACSAIDSPLPVSDFDAAQSYALMADDLPDGELDACAQSALAQAGLHGLDPSEAESWVHASADLGVWRLTGQLGCDALAVRGQSTPEAGLLNADPSSAAAGMLFLALLSERLDTTPGTLIRNLWDSTRQRSKGLVDNDRLRSSPDLWEVLQQTLEAQHTSLDGELIEFAAARYFAGPAPRHAQAPYRIFAALPSDAAVPIAREVASTELPAHVRDQPLLHDLGSAYVLVHLPESAAQARPSELQIWLHAETGPRWSLTAVRLDAKGREMGRTATPPRNMPNSYLPLAVDTETSEVVIIIMQLPQHTPDADNKVGTGHGYELIVSAK